MKERKQSGKNTSVGLDCVGVPSSPGKVSNDMDPVESGREMRLQGCLTSTPASANTEKRGRENGEGSTEVAQRENRGNLD